MDRRTAIKLLVLGVSMTATKAFSNPVESFFNKSENFTTELALSLPINIYLSEDEKEKALIIRWKNEEKIITVKEIWDSLDECIHEWVKGPFYLKAARTYEEPTYYPPNTLINIEHCKKCGILRLPNDLKQYQGKNLSKGKGK